MPILTSVRRLALSVVVALAIVAPSGDASAQGRGRPIVWLYRVLGAEAGATRIASEEFGASLRAGEHLGAEREAWALFRGGKIVGSGTSVPKEGLGRLEQGALRKGSTFAEQQANFLGARGPTAFTEELASAKIRHAFVETDAIFDVAGERGRRIVVATDTSATAKELEQADIVVAKDVPTAADVAAKVPGKPLYVMRSKSPLKSLMELDTPVRSVEIFHNVPTTVAEAEAIHGQKMSKSALGSLKKGARGLPKGERVEVVDLGETEGRTIASRLLEALERSGEQLRIVIAHIEAGALVFHDGSGLLLSKLKAFPRLFILACNSAEIGEVTRLGIGTVKDLSYAEAFAEADRATAVVVSGTAAKPATMGAVAGSLSKGSGLMKELVTLGILGVPIVVQVGVPRPEAQ